MRLQLPVARQPILLDAVLEHPQPQAQRIGRPQLERVEVERQLHDSTGAAAANTSPGLVEAFGIRPSGAELLANPLIESYEIELSEGS